MKRLMIIVIIATAFAPAFAQWTEPVKISESGGCYYPQILARGDTLHVVYENSSGYDKISYVRSIDGGETWSEHIVLSEPNGLTQFPRVVCRGNIVVALWKQIFNGGNRRFNIGYNNSTDGGITWGETQYIFEPNWYHILFFAACETDSMLSVILNSRVGNPLIFYDVKSTDFGSTWLAPFEMFSAYQSGMPDCACFDSLVHFSWDGRFDTDHDYEIYYINSTDGGDTWSANIALSDTDQYDSELPAIAVDEVGNPAVTWMDYKHSPNFLTGDILLRHSQDSGGSWSSEIQITDNHFALMSDIISNFDTLAVVWEDLRHENGRGSIYCIMTFDGGETWEDEERLDADTSESRNPSLAISNGNIYAVWYDERCEPDTQHCGGIYFSRFPAEPSGVESDGEALPTISDLTAYPNPFNSTIIITHKNLEGGEVGIYNINGQKIRTFETTQIKEGQIEWDARDALGNKISSGIYFARAKTSRNSNAIKLLYLK